MRSIVIDPIVADWVGRNLGLEFKDCAAIGVMVDGELACGVVYHDYRGYMVEVSIFATRRDWCTKSVLAVLFHYPFVQLGVRRFQAIISRKNRHARDFILRLGFTYEGMARRGYHDGNDAAVYSMLPHECRWLKEKDDGQGQQLAATGT